MTTVAGIFDDEAAAQRAVQALLNHHFLADQISALVPQHGHLEQVPVVRRDAMGTGAAVGAGLGAVLGTTLVSTGLLLGPVSLLGVGPVVAALWGAAAGGATGTAGGALMGLMDLFWQEADLPAQELSRGAIWISVDAPGRHAEAEAALRSAGARHLGRRPSDEEPVA
jgi:hypothetical protein